MALFDALRSHLLALPDLAKFAIAIAVIVGIPPLARRARLPEMVGLLLFGVLLGPYVFEFSVTTGQLRISSRSWENCC